VTFRPATWEDEEFFWFWRHRNEQAGRYGGWWKHPETTRTEHGAWFRQRLGRIEMLVWMYNDCPMGCVRIDSNGEVAFDTYADLARLMLDELKPYAAAHGRLKATVDRADWHAANALEDAGFREHPVRFFAYRP
jgi:hypothetical protein